MSVVVNGQTYYRTAEVCRMVGISRNTLFRWLREGVCNEPKYRDRRGWRLFNEDEVRRLKAEANRVSRTTDTEKVISHGTQRGSSARGILHEARASPK